MQEKLQIEIELMDVRIAEIESDIGSIVEIESGLEPEPTFEPQS